MEKAVKEHPNNSMAYTYLGQFIGMQARRMSDFSQITEIIDRAFLMWDKAISFAPEDIELRFTRGTLGVNFPFFAGKLTQGIEDLNMVINSNAPDSTKALAMYWLGFAYRKKARTQWIDVVKNYKDSRASKMVDCKICKGFK